MDLGKGFFKNRDADEISPDTTNLTNRDYQRDTALLDAKQDKFKHTHYVKVLEDILLKSEPPINIGLYGRWGVGKSSILNMLKSEIETILSKDFRYLYVDAWGLTGSTLQQEVLITINSQLKKYKESDLEDLLYNVREEKIVSLEKAFQRSWPLVILIVGIAIGYRFFSDQLINLIAVIGISTGVAVVSSVMKYALGTSKRILSGAVSSYQFGAIYDKIVKKEPKKLVVVIDNLDRCDDKVAVDLLGLIQTFMTRKNCINILACDDEAIVNHLHAVKGEAYTEKEGNEFLSKFFQVTIRIPPFIGENLDVYVSELISQRSIKFDPFVKQILISGAIKNPRKANQFLNNVVALYRLAELKEKDKRIPLDSITKHTDFLTKMIVLRHEWPKFYKYMEKNPGILDEVNSVFSGKLMELQLPEPIQAMFKDEEEEGLKDFLSATQYCTVRDIKPFLRLNQESYEGEIPEIEKFELDVSNGRLEVVTETLRNSNDKLKLDYVKKMISINDRHAKDGATAALLISTRVLVGALDVVDDQTMKQIALENLGRNLSSTLKEHFEKYDLNKLFPLISEMKSYYQDQLYRIMLDLIKVENKLNLDMIKQLLENNIYISNNSLAELDQKLTMLISENESEIINIIKEICINSSWASNKFAKPSQFIVTFISKILFDNSPVDNERIGIYLAIQNNLDLTEKKLFVKQVKISIDNLSNTNSILPTNLVEIIDNISKTMIQDLGPYVNDFFGTLTNATIKTPDQNQKKSLFEILFRIIKESEER